jgi:hypothetical protein
MQLGGGGGLYARDARRASIWQCTVQLRCVAIAGPTFCTGWLLSNMACCGVSGSPSDCVSTATTLVLCHNGRILAPVHERVDFTAF